MGKWGVREWEKIEEKKIRGKEEKKKGGRLPVADCRWPVKDGR
jgi:hypothetical protein